MSVGVHFVDCWAEEGRRAQAAVVGSAVELGIPAAVSWVRGGAASALFSARKTGVQQVLLSARPPAGGGVELVSTD